ncbi:ribonuclease D [Candidatus Nesciobacter abundans]|uniref:Ribonuclease D n=1 Tax=Candidatus Nesciobacter abundans TaxID=2601668 RepID=A0A5C0UGI8_9PROT|nr:ribonuclease H-like domain-containing protein [Candidatus Nesciobacter abundans]QEK39188.1 ribonuclease D [Candidatus Nesciobacter abundans]
MHKFHSIHNTTILVHKRDLPDDLIFGNSVAIDTETTGLHIYRDRICLIQICFNDGFCHLVQIEKGQKEAKNIQRLLKDENIEKLFHFGRFDMAMLYNAFGVMANPIYCTKLASKLARTYTERHGLKTICREFLAIDIPKEKQSSDWGADILTEAQKQYAAGDVLYLHQIQENLNEILVREGRIELAKKCFDFLESIVRLDCAGWHDMDIFAHL